MRSECKRNITFDVLNKEKIEKIHEKSLYIMEKVGMRVSGDRSVKLLKDHGAVADENGNLHFSEKMVEWALKSAPKSLTLYNRNQEPQMTIDSRNQVYFGTHSDQLYFVDPIENRVRKFLKEDTRTMCRVASYLNNIDFVLSVGLSADVKPDVQTQTTFIETLKHFNKTINFSSNDIDSLQDCIDIAADFAGGLQKFQDKPFAFNYCEPIPPLTHPKESTEKLYISAQNRVPVVYMPYCMMGGTSPLNKATTLVQCNAEALTGLILSQLVSEGTPFIYGAMPSVMDMRSTIGSYAAPEFHLNIAAMADLVAYYGLPFYGTAGCSDAKIMDFQAAAEVSQQVMSTVLSKANLVHDVGVMDHCNSVSPELVVMANEVIESCKHYSLGIDTDEIDLDIIEEVGHGGEYVTHDSTLENFKSVWYPQYFSRKMVNPDESLIQGEVLDKLNFIIHDWDGPSLDKDSLDLLVKWEKKFNI